MSATGRVVILIDMDCFYCQVEEKLDPNLEGEPIAVVQYNAWKGGGIIAVNYPARDLGVTRHMRGSEAKQKCPSIKLVQVPEVRGKADLTKYRDAGKRVADVLQTFTPLLERASVDEAYLDVTEAVKKRIAGGLRDMKFENMKNTFIVGCDTEAFLDNIALDLEFNDDNLKLAVGALIAEEIRLAVFNQTGYKCSAGIAHNKILAKLVCGLHKPNKQTVLPQEAVAGLFETMPVNKVKSLGGKFGKSLSEDLGITFMAQLAQFSIQELTRKFDDKTANWLYNVARGIDLEPVTSKLLSKSIASCKNFRGRAALRTSDSVQHWLGELAQEISVRLQKDLKENNRKAKQMVVSFNQGTADGEVSSTRTHPLPSYDYKKIAQSAFEVVKKFCLKTDGTYCLTFLGISVSNFEDCKNVREITSFFKVGESSKAPKKSLDVPSEVADTADSTLNLAEFEDETASVYLALTQELEEDVHNLVFYDDSCRISKNQPIASLHSQLMNLNTQSSKATPKKSLASSFFQKYFVQTNANEVRPGPSGEVEVGEKVDFSTESQAETCPECNKKILKTDFMSHQDYHFALKLVKEETNSQRNNSAKVSETPKKIARSKSSKRKNCGGDSGVLLTFFRKHQDETLDNDVTETCTECGRKVKTEELESHMDYHAAKKLHREINSATSNNTSVKTKKDNKSKTCNNGVRSFFKPL